MIYEIKLNIKKYATLNIYTTSEDIKNKTVNVVTTNEYVEVEVIYEVLENIGTKEKIVF